MKNNRHRIYLFLLLLAILVNFSGFPLDFFSDDPGLYGSISKNLLYRHQFWQLFTYNQDWLDKPHFPFWAVALSFRLFGISVWAYRLPAMLFFLIALRYTYLFSKKYYGEEVAWLATLILATSQHLIMSNTDVRAEPYLMAMVIGSIYHISQLEKRFALSDLALAALLTALAMMTKGIFVTIAIYGALFGQLVLTGKYREIFRPKWALLLLLTGLFLLPELYALYIQFDLHPEKLVFGRHHVSGIKWFFWDSQFGRFVNSGPITRKSGDIFFFLHTLLWAFAPWCLLFYYAVFKSVSDIVRRKPLTEYFAISGGLLLLCLFSLSGFQLPFYTNTIFPLFAIITAPLCYEQLSKFAGAYRSMALWLYIVTLPLAILAIHYLAEPGYNGYLVAGLLFFTSAGVFIWMNAGEKRFPTFLLACIASLFANFYLNTVFYKLIISYRGQIKAAAFVNQQEFENYSLNNLGTENNIFQFYVHRPIKSITNESFDTVKTGGNELFFANQKTIEQFRGRHKGFTIVKAFPNYKNETILPAFINKRTRGTVIDSVYLLRK